VTPPDPLRSAALASLLPAGWGKPVLVLAGGVLASELIARVLPGDGFGFLGLGALAGVCWWLGGRARPPLRQRLPRSFDGWFRRCQGVLQQFEQLEGSAAEGQPNRRQALEQLRNEGERSSLQVALVGSQPPAAACSVQFQQALRAPLALCLLWGHALPVASGSWQWPAEFVAADLLLFHLVMPLRAADLRWLEAVPADQPVWLLVQPDRPGDPDRHVAELLSQWPAGDPDRLLFWDGRPEQLELRLQPLVLWLAREGKGLLAATPLRRIEALHRHWQGELERLRRRRLRQLQQRTQWIVAAGVFAAPLPSLDLLVLTAANGLMLQEMARLWDCPWTLDQLRAAAVELGRAALVLGVVEWSTQALVAAVRLHGATWLLGGALQSLSAAYLTRVIGHAMADVLALSAGVEAPDLKAIKQEAPLLVARAAEAEKLDWAGFLQQGRTWIDQQRQAGGGMPLPSVP
jgi:hypothetical protein